MTDVPAADLRDITAVKTVCFWLRHELSIVDPDIMVLTMVIENRWWRHHHQGRDALHIEAACRRFVSLLEVHVNLEVQP